MKVNEFLEGIKDMTPAERRQLGKLIMENSDGAAVFQAELDRQVNRAVMSHDEKLKAAGQIGNQAELEKRLDRIEKAYQEKLGAMELEYYVKQRAAESGIDVRILEGSYTEKSQIDDRVELISASMERQRVADTNRDMVKNSHRPGTGSGSRGVPDVRNMSPGQIIELEKSGRLNDLIPKGGSREKF